MPWGDKGAWNTSFPDRRNPDLADMNFSAIFNGNDADAIKEEKTIGSAERNADYRRAG